MTRRRLSARPEFRADIRRLPTANLQRRALQILADVAGGQNLGEPLEDHPPVGVTHVRTFHRDVDEPLPGSELAEAEHAISREQWRDSKVGTRDAS